MPSATWNVGNVQHVVNAEIRNVDVDCVGNFARLATNFDLANDLFQHALLFAHADRLADQVQRHGHFNLLALDQALEIGMNQTACAPDRSGDRETSLRWRQRLRYQA